MFAIKHWWPTVVFTCSCDPRDPATLVLAGTTTAVDCPKCATHYRIDAFAFNRKDDSIAIEIGERKSAVALPVGARC